MSDSEGRELTPAERARLRRRDRKRETRMVVDNAGMKRVLPAIAERRRSGSAQTEQRDSEKR